MAYYDLLIEYLRVSGEAARAQAETERLLQGTGNGPIRSSRVKIISAQIERQRTTQKTAQEALDNLVASLPT